MSKLSIRTLRWRARVKCGDRAMKELSKKWASTGRPLGRTFYRWVLSDDIRINAVIVAHLLKGGSLE